MAHGCAIERLREQKQPSERKVLSSCLLKMIKFYSSLTRTMPQVGVTQNPPNMT